MGGPTAAVMCRENAEIPTVDKVTGTAGPVGDHHPDSLLKEGLNFS